MMQAVERDRRSSPRTANASSQLFGAIAPVDKSLHIFAVLVGVCISEIPSCEDLAVQLLLFKISRFFYHHFNQLSDRRHDSSDFFEFSAVSCSRSVFIMLAISSLRNVLRPRSLHLMLYLIKPFTFLRPKCGLSRVIESDVTYSVQIKSSSDVDYLDSPRLSLHCGNLMKIYKN